MLVLVAAFAVSAVAAGGVPLPRPRPAMPQDAGIVSIETPHGPPTDCDRRLDAIAVFTAKPTMAGPGECGGDDLVALSAVVLPNGRRVEMKPAATLRCEMAESLASWVRDEVAPPLADEGGGLVAIQQEDSYDCRNRNSASHGKVSEHAHGKAIDLRAFVLADKSTLTLTDVRAPKDLRTAFHDTACRRFMTVLGPGEPYHDEHIHLDVIERRSGYRICSWAVREPPPPVVAKAAPDAPAPEEEKAETDPSGTPAQESAGVDPSEPAGKERQTAVAAQDRRGFAKGARAKELDAKAADEDGERPMYRRRRR